MSFSGEATLIFKSVELLSVVGILPARGGHQFGHQRKLRGRDTQHQKMANKGKGFEIEFRARKRGKIDWATCGVFKLFQGL